MPLPSLSRAQAVAIAALLFAVSILIRHPLFNHEFTGSWEWLSAHTLLTNQLWNETPASVHHFNLLYTFPSPTDKFIDDLWQSGVPDKYGNYYYVSMPHLAFLTPYLFFRLTGQQPSLPGMQVFALLAHLLACFLIYLLVRQLTQGYAASRLAALAAFGVMLFAPTALFFYQNAVVGTVLVIPYTIGVLMSVTALTTKPRPFAWLALLLCLLLGCLTDWQAYFTALATALVVLAVTFRRRIDRRTGFGIAALCCLAVVLAGVIIVAQDSRINGLQPFLTIILGRFKVRVGASAAAGLGLTTFGYYRNLARFYLAYAPFLLLSMVLIVIIRRRQSMDEIRQNVLARTGLALIISMFAVLIDHLVLANHTSQQSFTTLNSLVPIGILTGTAVLALIETSTRVRRDMIAVSTALVLCAGVCVAEYYVAYLHRPHPYTEVAAAIQAVALPSDLLLSTGDGFQMPSDFAIPQLLFYLRHNVKVVSSEAEANQYVACHLGERGILTYLTPNYHVTRIAIIRKTKASCPVLQSGE